METLPNLGGLKLTNLQKFDSALKISWLKRLSIHTEGWAIYPIHYGFGKILRYGDEYQEKLIAKTQNWFWKDTARSINELYKTLKYTSLSQIQNTPLWYNSKFKFEYRQKWDEKGYILLSDILTEEGSLLTEVGIRDKGLKINFLDYHKLVKEFKNLTRGIIKGIKTTGPHIPRLMFEVGLSNKGCNRTYNKLMMYNSNIIIEVKNKWERVLNEEIPYNVVEKGFIAIPRMVEGPYHKYFQFRLLHSRIMTNKKLHCMKISDTEICPVCFGSIETIKHAFLDCHFAVALWNQIEDWWKNITKEHIKFNDTEKIFGCNRSDDLIDKVIISTKLVIYNNRKKGKRHHINEVKKLLYNQLNLEEYQARMDLDEGKFLRKWERLYNDLTDLFA